MRSSSIPSPRHALLLFAAMGCNTLGVRDRAAVFDPDGDGVDWPDDCDNTDAAVQDVPDVAWTLASQESEPANDTPPAAISLEVTAGIIVTGQLDGYGWDAATTPDRTATCDETTVDSDFPPLDQGNYAGDLDWVTIDPRDSETLCVTVELGSAELNFDLLLYELDACGNPVAAHLNEGGHLLGLGNEGDHATISAPVTAGAPVAVLLAGYLPAGSSAEVVGWRIGLSLISTEIGTCTALCPELPSVD